LSLAVSIEFPTEKETIRFEKYLKSGSGRAFAKRHSGNEPGAEASGRAPTNHFGRPSV
jgi:hypothetical protein